MIHIEITPEEGGEENEPGEGIFQTGLLESPAGAAAKV